MNLSSRKKKPTEKDGEAGQATARPGWLAHLKDRLGTKGGKRRRKAAATKGDAPTEQMPRPGEPQPQAGANADRQDSEEQPPTKPGWRMRLNDALSAFKRPSRKPAPPDDGERTPIIGQGGKESPEQDALPPTAARPQVWRYALAVLTLGAAGGSFFAWNWQLPSAQHAAAKAAGSIGPQRAVAAQALGAGEIQQKLPAQPSAAPKDQTPPPQQDAAAPATAAASQPTGEAQATLPAGAGMQAQIDALKKQNQELQAQIDALKKQAMASSAPQAADAPQKAAAPPKDGVLIINGENVKESAQGLKEVIKQMNAASAPAKK